MKKYFLLPLLLIPVLVFIFHAAQLNQRKGHYFHSGYFDPSYLYLNSCLNIACGKFPVHVDNPGAPIQLIGAVVFRLTHWLSGKDEFVNDILKRPEYYLEVLNLVLVSFVALGVFICGWLAYRISGDAMIAILLQFSPFFSESQFYGLIRVSPESFLMMLGLVLNLLILRILIKQDLESNQRFYILFFGIFCGLGVATKLNFLPTCLLPFFLLSGWKPKFYYFLVTLLSFCIIAFLPLFGSEKLFLWTRDLFFQSGIYATGERNVIDTNTFLPNLQTILSLESLYATVLIGMLIAFFLFRFSNAFREVRRLYPNTERLILGLTLVQFLHLVMVAKHYNHHYLLPSLMLAAGSLPILFFVMRKPFKTSYQDQIGGGLIILMLLVLIPFRWSDIQEDYNKREFSKQNAEKAVEFVDKHAKGAVSVSYYGSSSTAGALHFGTYSFFAENKVLDYDLVLKNYYPDCFFLHNGKLYDWGVAVEKDSILKKYDTVILQGMPVGNQYKQLFHKMIVTDSLITESEVIYVLKNPEH